MTGDRIGTAGDGLGMYDEMADWFHFFPRVARLDLLRRAGFEPSVTTDPWERDVFIAIRPA